MRINVPIPEEIRKIALEDSSVYTALKMHQDGVLSWEQTLENLVVVLAKQKKELQTNVIKLTQMTVTPKKMYVNMSKKEIEKLKEHGEIQLKKPVYEDKDD